MIYITHGVISRWSGERISHALFLPESRVAKYLQLRCTKYVPLAQAMSGGGDALTVDDATHAGLRLVLLARHYGHAVSWFVNGSYVEHNVQYYPFQISWMLDHTHAPECRFEGKTWNLQTMAGRRALRLRVKQVYMLLRNQGEIANLIESLCGCLQVDVQNVERALTTVRPAELAKAVLAGVDLQNHSWTHLNPQVFSERERTAEVLQNEEYLLQFRRVLTRTFAPPFGQQVILASVPADFVLLANRNLVPDHKEGNLINRGDLLLNDFPQNSPDSAASVRRIAA